MTDLMWVIAMDRGSIWSVLGADGALSCRDQERERRDHQKSWENPLAEAVAFLISALTSLQNVSAESSCDPHAERILASVCGKMVDALCALDYLSVTQWIRSEIDMETISIRRRRGEPDKWVPCERVPSEQAVPWIKQGELGNKS
jgi:hypothetical protein